MRDVTADEVRRAVAAAGITRVDHHDCAGCGYMTHYSVDGGQLFFHPGCDCGRYAPREPRSWDSAADWINMQSRPDIKEQLAKSFGIAMTAQPGNLNSTLS